MQAQMQILFSSTETQATVPSPRSVSSPSTCNRVGLLVLSNNASTRAAEKLLRNKFGSRMSDYELLGTYDLVLVLLYRTSSRLDPLVETMHRGFSVGSNTGQIIGICVYHSVWDDACDYHDILAKYNQMSKILQINVWNEQVQCSKSPCTERSIRSLDELNSTENLPISQGTNISKRVSRMFTSYIFKSQ